MAVDWQAPLRHQVPEGVKDRLPREAARLRRLSGALLETFRRWGYREVITPAFEFLETVLAGQGPWARREDYYQFFDRRGRTLVLRPDLTAPMARLAATKLSGEPLPLRLCAWGPVFRHRERRSGVTHEIWQADVELIGAGGTRADAEIIALACDALRAAGLEGFQMGVGHVAFVEGVLEEAGVSPEAGEALKEALAARDLVAFEKVALAAAPPGRAGLLLDLTACTGDFQAALERYGHLPNPRVQRALAELGETLALLEAYGVADQVAVDLGLARLFGYYTGIVFEAYAPGVGAPVLGGGRYDHLLAEFAASNGAAGGPPAPSASLPATGFAIDADRVLQALDRQGRAEPAEGLDVLLVPAPGAEAAAMARARALRAQGLAVEVDLAGRDGPELAAYAAARGAARVERVPAGPGAGAGERVHPAGAAAAEAAAVDPAARRRRPRPAGVPPIH